MCGSLGSLVSDKLGGQRNVVTPVVKRYTPGTYSFRVAKSGWYRFALWGPGGRGGGAGPLGGGGGGFVLADRPLAMGQTVTIVTGKAVIGGVGSDTVVTLPTGEILTAGAGKEFNDGTSPGGGGVATSSSSQDTKTPGTAGSATLGGVGASTADLLAGAAGTSTISGETPAAGAGPNAALPAGDGLVMLFQVRIGQ